MSTFETIAALVAKHTGHDASEITPETKLLEDLGMDSLDAVELIMSLEEEFGIAIPSDQTQELTTVAELTALVERISGKQ